MKQIFLVALMAGTIFTSCEKEKSCALSATSLVGKYKLTEEKDQQNPTAAYVNSYTNINTPLTFEANGTYYDTTAGIPAVPPKFASHGTWTLSGNSLTMHNDANSSTNTLTVKSFDCNTLKVKVIDDPNTGENTITTFTRQ